MPINALLTKLNRVFIFAPMAFAKVFKFVRPSQLAAALGESPQTVANWRKRGLPHDRALLVARAVDWRVTPHELIPELYPHPDDGLPEDRRGR